MEGPASAYLFVRQLYVACVAVSLAGFVLRGALMLARSPLLGARFVRVAFWLPQKRPLTALITVFFPLYA